MKTIIYRGANTSDFDAIKELIRASFKLDKYVSDVKVLDELLNVYLYTFLKEQTYNQVATYNGQVIGVIMGQSKSDTSFATNFEYKLKLMKHRMALSLLARNKKIDLNPFNEYKKEQTSLHNLHKGTFDGAMILLVVSAESQGLGVEQELLTPLRKYWLQHYSKTISFFTDSSCNVGLYDQMGFERMESNQIHFGDKILELYLLSLNL